MTAIRVAATAFILILIVLSVMGWLWNDAYQAADQAVAGQAVLALGALAGVAGLVAIWRWPRRTP